MLKLVGFPLLCCTSLSSAREKVMPEFVDSIG